MVSTGDSGATEGGSRPESSLPCPSRPPGNTDSVTDTGPRRGNLYALLRMAMAAAGADNSEVINAVKDVQSGYLVEAMLSDRRTAVQDSMDRLVVVLRYALGVGRRGMQAIVLPHLRNLASLLSMDEAAVPGPVRGRAC